ncbi:MAG TPA: NfeD family protein, partial [Gammaproteobacteria bacterium]
MDLLTGLLLLAVIVTIIVIVVRELFDESIAELSASYFRAAPNPVQSNLIGKRGEVIESPLDEKVHYRVRIGREIWSARAAESVDFDVGAEIEVTD